jgi:glycosyltransferase involved in cell wall biosynthesis/peptidoglycan/xylan/chitin deacetylase (PgdA/CDA1 family)
VSAPLVLCYHAVSETWDSPLAVTPERFERQLRHWLHRGYQPATFTDALTRPSGARTLVVTFDDAFASVDELAHPIMHRLGVPGTVFVPTGFAPDGRMLLWDGIDQWQHGADARELRCMSFEELRALADTGWEIGSHTVSHPRLTRLGDAELDRELCESRDACATAIGRPCDAVAYPYGDVDQRVVEHAALAGYRAGAALPGRPNRGSVLSWPRVGVYRRDTAMRVAAKRARARVVRAPERSPLVGGQRVAVYTDQAYRADADGVASPRAFAGFLARLADEFDELTLLGRLEPTAEPAPHRLPATVRFVALPSYGGRSQVAPILRSLAGSIRVYWRVLDDVDSVWLLGPNLPGLLFAALAIGRRRRVVLGVRQDLPTYVRARHPGRSDRLLAAWALELSWRLLARRLGVVVVGEQLARNYHAARPAQVSVSLVKASEVLEPHETPARDWHGDVRLLSVGRLDTEKNPLLLADMLARLPAHFTLTVCGAGPLTEPLEERIAELGLNERCRLVGHLTWTSGLRDLYLRSDGFIHVSLTEGEPQVLHEAFAAGLPTVATAVGGVAAAATGAALLVPAGDSSALATAVKLLAADPALRRALTLKALERARSRTIEHSCRTVADYLRTPRRAHRRAPHSVEPGPRPTSHARP